MRSANQFNNARRLGTDAQDKDGVWKARGKPNDAKRMRLPRIGRRGTYAPHSGGGNGHVSCEGRSGNRNIVRVGGDSSKLHPEITATPRTGAGWRGRPHADTLARWRRLAQSGVAAHKPRALAGTPPCPTPPSPHPQHPNEAPRNGKIRAPCVIRGGLCSEKGVFLARYSRDVSSNGDLQGFSHTWRAYLAIASSFWMHGGDMLPGRGAFPVRGPFGDA